MNHHENLALNQAAKPVEQCEQYYKNARAGLSTINRLAYSVVADNTKNKHCWVADFYFIQSDERSKTQARIFAEALAAKINGVA